MAVSQVKRVEMRWDRNGPACAESQGEERLAHLGSTSSRESQAGGNEHRWTAS